MVRGVSPLPKDCQAPNSLFAVSTPGGKELHHPHIITLQHHLVKVVIGELNHILLTATAASTTALLEDGWVLLNHVHLRVWYLQFEITTTKSYCTSALLDLPVCCSQSRQTCRSASLSPEHAKRSWLRPQWPGYCVHLKGEDMQRSVTATLKVCLPTTSAGRIFPKQPWKLVSKCAVSLTPTSYYLWTIQIESRLYNMYLFRKTFNRAWWGSVEEDVK